MEVSLQIHTCVLQFLYILYFAMKKEITIKEIAKELDLHHATVSRALNGNSKVKEETRNLVLEKAKELGYKPNLLAQNFRNKRSNIITIIVPDLKPHFFSRFTSDITDLTNDGRFMVMVFQSNDDPNVEKKILASLVSLRVSGVAVSIGLRTKSTDHFNILKDENIPLVFFDRVPMKTQFSTITLDNYNAVGLVVDEMVKRGKRKIAYITCNSHLKVFKDRLAGYENAISKAGLSYKKYVCIDQMFINDGYKIAPFLVDRKEKPDAIICVNDEVAIGVMRYLKEKKYSIPNDISVSGFDDNPMGKVFEPALSTLSQSTKILSKTTFDFLISQIEGKSSAKEDIILPMKLKIRSSL